MRRSTLLLLLACSAVWGQPQKDRHVILITLDGFPAYALQDPTLSVPNLRRLAREGATADHMITSNPTVTWPNHTSMVTGVPPARHSVLYNGQFIRETGKVDSLKSKAELVQAPTVYDRAHAAGLTTAEIDWVAILNAPTITWSFAERPSVTDGIPKEMIAAGLVSEQDVADFGKRNITYRDQIWTQAAIYIMQKHRPNLMLFHLLATDSAHHQFGPKSLASLTALALADARVGDLYRALEAAKLLPTTSIIVASDHGFKVVRRQIHPLVLIKQDAQIIPEGGTAMVYLNGRKSAAEIKAVLQGVEGVDRIVEPAEYAALGLPAPAKNHRMADMVIAAKDGYSFAGGDSGDLVTPAAVGSLGSHGYLNTDPEMNAIFIAWGRGVRPGVKIPEVRNIDIGPTIASLLGLKMENTAGSPLTAILEK
ncbi:MAG: ectonucleotide pyrophosphatase/phosphodiesterase [Bryobacteraceae bacterium]